jgi:hypothetical protein
MKKMISFLLLVVLLAGCSNSENANHVFTEKMAKPFEIVKYEEKIAPVYGNLVPHIAYAKTEGQLESLKARFQVDDFDIDMEKNMALFIVVNSDSCGIIVDGVYEKDGSISAQLVKPVSQNCEVDPVPHTFVVQVEQGDYERVQLYDGNVLKSTMEIKE